MTILQCYRIYIAISVPNNASSFIKRYLCQLTSLWPDSFIRQFDIRHQKAGHRGCRINETRLYHYPSSARGRRPYTVSASGESSPVTRALMMLNMSTEHHDFNTINTKCSCFLLSVIVTLMVINDDKSWMRFIWVFGVSEPCPHVCPRTARDRHPSPW